VLPDTIACTSRAAGTALWPPSSTPPLPHPHGHRFGTLVYGAGGGWHSATAQLSVLPAGLQLQEKLCFKGVLAEDALYCLLLLLTPLPSLLPHTGPFTHAGEERKSKAILKPSLSSSLFIHCAEWCSEKLH